MVDNDGREVIVFPPDGPLSDGMCNAADMNQGLPLALVNMALDQAFGSLDSDSPTYFGAGCAVMRLEFETALGSVVARYVRQEFTGY